MERQKFSSTMWIDVFLVIATICVLALPQEPTAAQGGATKDKTQYYELSRRVLTSIKEDVMFSVSTDEIKQAKTTIDGVVYLAITGKNVAIVMRDDETTFQVLWSNAATSNDKADE